MATITESTVVAAPPRAIWDLLADLRSPTRYSPQVTAVRLLGDQAEGVGAERHCDLVDGGYFKERVVSWNPGREIAMEIYDADGPLKVATGTFTMEPRADGGTDLTCRMDVTMRFGPLGSLMAATVAKRQFRSLVRGLLAGIKAEVETTAGAAA